MVCRLHGLPLVLVLALVLQPGGSHCRWVLPAKASRAAPKGGMEAAVLARMNCFNLNEQEQKKWMVHDISCTNHEYHHQSCD